MSSSSQYQAKFDAFDQSQAAKIVAEEFPFLEFLLNERNQITSVNICGVNCWFQLSTFYGNSIGISHNNVQDSYTCAVLDDINVARVIKQLLMHKTLFQTHYTIFMMGKLLEPLQKQINDLYTMISCAPGGLEFQKAKEHFESYDNQHE